MSKKPKGAKRLRIRKVKVLLTYHEFALDNGNHVLIQADAHSVAHELFVPFQLDALRGNFGFPQEIELDSVR